MSWMHRFDVDGRYLGKVVQDRPLEDYAGRTDLTTEQPPDEPIGYTAYWTNNQWVLRLDPPPPPPVSPAPRLWEPWALAARA
jgi:hypothetical protein